MIKIYIFMATLCVNLHENEAENRTEPNIAKLEFWKPDPKFNEKFFKNRRQIHEVEKDNKIYYKHSRINPRFTRPSEVQNTSQKYIDWLSHARHFESNAKHRAKIPLEPKDLRSRTEKNEWQRPKRLRHRGRVTGEDCSKEAGLSTRMTPMYLMQQPHESEPTHATTPRTTTEDTEHLEALSPYSLENQMRRMLSEYKDVNVSYEVIGRTVEYNNILLVKLSEQKTDIGKYFRAEESKYIEEVPEKKIVFIVHGLSVLGMPRLATLCTNHYFSVLLDYYIQHLDTFDIFLIPMANPDGYVAATSKTLWNKNVSPQSACRGVALDRNFDVAWNSAKVISSCSQLYPGPTPFSEAESKAVRDVFHHYGHKIIAYIHVHPGTPSYDTFKGDAILYPKGFTEVQSDDDKYIDLRGEIEEMMRNASFQVMSVTVDTLHNWYGKVYGSSVDYASTVYGIPYAMEFVMQIYENDPNADYIEDLEDLNALVAIWQRVIDVVFNNIWKNMHANDVK